MLSLAALVLSCFALVLAIWRLTVASRRGDATRLSRELPQYWNGHDGKVRFYRGYDWGVGQDPDEPIVYNGEGLQVQLKKIFDECDSPRKSDGG